MTPKQLALQHMQIIFDGKDPRLLDGILDHDFNFSGPLYNFDNKRDYIQSFIDSPPENFKYKIMHISETDQTVCIVYEFTKKEISMPMAQLFKVRGEKIVEVLLIFDTGVL